jgi:hypothetical protein
VAPRLELFHQGSFQQQEGKTGNKKGANQSKDADQEDFHIASKAEPLYFTGHKLQAGLVIDIETERYKTKPSDTFQFEKSYNRL